VTLYPISASMDGQRVTSIGNSGTTKGRKAAALKDPAYYSPPPDITESAVQEHARALTAYNESKAKHPPGSAEREQAARRLAAARVKVSGFVGQKAIGRPAHLSNQLPATELANTRSAVAERAQKVHKAALANRARVRKQYPPGHPERQKAEALVRKSRSYLTGNPAASQLDGRNAEGAGTPTGRVS
jgi:hypothetical protein